MAVFLAKHWERTLWLVVASYTWLEVHLCGWWVICTEDFSLFLFHPPSKIACICLIGLRQGNSDQGFHLVLELQMQSWRLLIVWLEYPPTNSFFVFTETLKRSQTLLQRSRGSKIWRLCSTQRTLPWPRLLERSVTSRWKTGTWRRRLPR